MIDESIKTCWVAVVEKYANINIVEREQVILNPCYIVAKYINNERIV